MKMVRRIVLVVAVIVAVIAAWQIYTIVMDGFNSDTANSEIVGIADDSDGDGRSLFDYLGNFIGGGSSYQTEEQLRAAQMRRINFAALQARNPDIVAWIYIPNTVVNYAVTQTTNNDFYLDHNALRQFSRAGAIFLDFECASDFSAIDTIVYGHHMRDRTMFGVLPEYANATFAAGHRYIFIYTPTETRRYSYATSFRSMSRLERSTDTEVQMLTLVTCNYTGGYSHYVVRATLYTVREPGAAP